MKGLSVVCCRKLSYRLTSAGIYTQMNFFFICGTLKADVKIYVFTEKKSGQSGSAAVKPSPAKTGSGSGSSDAESEISGLSGDGIGEALPVSGKYIIL